MNGVTESPPGRRILIAVVTGAVGDAIQRWREDHDPEQARRIPPHTTLAYWAPTVDPASLDAQVHHAFPEPVRVRLGAAQTFANADRTIYLPVLDTAGLDAARVRLYDGTHLPLARDRDWEWHVTCVRYARDRDHEALLAAAALLPSEAPWSIETVAYMELRGGRYESLATWTVPSANDRR